MTACKMMRRWRELMATMVTLAFFVAQHMKTWANEVFYMPVICRDKVGLGIARRYIGMRSAWIEIDAQLVRPRCGACLSVPKGGRLRNDPSTPLQSLPQFFLLITALSVLWSLL
jgi:hypothetical protein